MDKFHINSIYEKGNVNNKIVTNVFFIKQKHVILELSIPSKNKLKSSSKNKSYI